MGSGIQIYRDERLGGQSAGQPGYFLADAVPPNGVARHTGSFRRLIADLERWADRVDAADRTAVGQGLESARAARRGLTAPVAAVGVLLEDRPGEIARVGQALAETGADVRDLQLRHATRGGGGVLMISVPPGHEERLARALLAQGFRLTD